MQLKPEEISKVIRSQIKYYDNAIHQNETGTILMVGDGIARASGLINCMAGELLEFEDGSYGMAQNLEENSVSIVLFGDGEKIGRPERQENRKSRFRSRRRRPRWPISSTHWDSPSTAQAPSWRTVPRHWPLGICERRSVHEPLRPVSRPSTP